MSVGRAASVGMTPRRNPLFPLGVDYHPHDAESAQPDAWYAGDFDADFAEFAEARLTLVRIFISWRLFEPQVGKYSDEAGTRLHEMVESAGAHRLRLIVCFFSEERHAGLLDVVWARRRDPRTDGYLIERQAALVRHIVETHRSDRAVFAWELANEAFCSGFRSAEELKLWADQMRDAVRELDENRPVMVGVDAETLFHTSRVDARPTLDSSEIRVAHRTNAYRGYVAEGPVLGARSTYLDAWLLHASSRTVPVLLDLIGPHALDASHAEEAASLRCSLYSGLMNDASGALVSRWRDMLTDRRAPYHVDEFESLVGVRDSEGRPKAAMRELAAFSRMVAQLDLRRLTRVAERAAVMVPAERSVAEPTLPSLFAPRSCLEAFVRAKEAHLPVTVTREHEPFDPYAMLIVPSVTDVAPETWARLAEWVHAGGSLVYSYGGGEFSAEARQLFGVDFLGHGGARTRATCRVAQQGMVGTFEPFDTAARVPHFALLGPGASTVVATDAAGNPLVTLSRPGQGRAVCVAAPFERVLGQTGLRPPLAEIATFVRTLYGAIGGVAGCGPRVACDSPSVELALLSGEERDALLLLNHAGEPVTATLRFERPVATVTRVGGGEGVSVGGVVLGVPLDAYGAAALWVSYDSGEAA